MKKALRIIGWVLFYAFVIFVGIPACIYLGGLIELHVLRWVGGDL